MATRAEISAALDHYTKVGNQDAARKLKATLDAMPPDSDGATYTAPKPAAPEGYGLKQAATDFLNVPKAAYGTLETAGSLATGMIAAPIAALGAGIATTAKQILNGEFGTEEASRAVEIAAENASTATTYIPRTDVGKAQLGAIGKAVAPFEDALTALGPLAAEAPTITQTARTAAAAGRSAAELTGVPAAVEAAAGRAGSAVTDAAVATRDAAKGAASRVGAALERPAPASAAGERSAGAAEVSAADVRRANAAELGFKDDARLTKGQATQETTEIGFEREQAKSVERGADIRDRFEKQTRVAEGVFDQFVDATGGSVPDFSGGGKVALGGKIEKALSEGAARQKAEVRTKYAKAEKEEGGLSTSGDSVAQYLTDNASARGTAPILKAAQAEAKRLGIATKDGGGQATDIKTLYELRKFISKNAGQDGSSAFHAGELKKLIDERIAADGGPLYQQATAAHARFSSQYKDASLINGILKNKPGSPDRIIASDQILNRVLADGTSVGEIKHMRRLMQTHGEEAGQAAWKDLQAGGIEYLRDITYKRAKPGPNGTLRPNATQLNNAVNKLDQAGKLDTLYGTQGAEKIRLFRDIVRDIENTEGANHSGTSNALIEFLEAVPVAGPSVAKGRKLLNAVGSHVTDRKLRARIKENLK